eukprot:2239766-Pyramimonas_sp.AAC.1
MIGRIGQAFASVKYVSGAVLSRWSGTQQCEETVRGLTHFTARWLTNLLDGQSYPRGMACWIFEASTTVSNGKC